MLNFTTSLLLQETEQAVQQRIKRYFDQQGYRTLKDSRHLYEFERGAIWRNYFTNNPRKWFVSASTKLHSVDSDDVWLDVKLNVDTQGQMMVLERERQYWETEFEVLTTYLETGKHKDTRLLEELGKRNLRQNIMLSVALVFAFMVVSALVVGGIIALAACTC